MSSCTRRRSSTAPTRGRRLRAYVSGESWFVTIAFTPEASARFADATTRHVHRRIAILLDGVVQSAPEIREPISGGTARITMGAGDSETQRADAKALILSLEAGRSPPP